MIMIMLITIQTNCMIMLISYNGDDITNIKTNNNDASNTM